MSSQSSVLFPLKNAWDSSSFLWVSFLSSSIVMVKPQGNDRAHYPQKIILKPNSMPKPMIVLIYMFNVLFLILHPNLPPIILQISFHLSAYLSI